MNNNPIKLMHAEHDIISKADEIVSNSKDLWILNESNYVNIVRQLLIFFREYADGYHHRKEEDVLFPAIISHPDFVLHEIIDEFNNHHENFRDYTRKIEAAINNKEYESSYSTLKEYCNDLLDHIAAENEELFVLAENLLSDEDLEKIYFQFRDIDIELGESRKLELENFPEKIQQLVQIN